MKMNKNKKLNRYWNTPGGLTIVELTQGQYGLFDTEDWKKIKYFKFNAWNSKGTKPCKPLFYIKTGRKQLAHRLIMNIVDPKILIDHKNGNTLDCRKENLRISTKSTNGMNRDLQNNNTSGHRGVWWHKNIKRWISRIKVNQNNIYLGCFINKEDAIKVRKEAEIKYFGKFNFHALDCQIPVKDPLKSL